MPTDMAVAEQLLERENTAVVPGDAFGAPRYLRIPCAISLERIERFFTSGRGK